MTNDTSPSNPHVVRLFSARPPLISDLISRNVATGVSACDAIAQDTACDSSQKHTQGKEGHAGEQNVWAPHTALFAGAANIGTRQR
jgi:hypothetical protein